MRISSFQLQKLIVRFVRTLSVQMVQIDLSLSFAYREGEHQLFDLSSVGALFILTSEEMLNGASLLT
jgi:hypothetical protein